MKRRNQAWIWVFVFLLLSILPFLTLGYFGFMWIIFPFSLWISIKTIIEILKGEYD